jgi:hypothetical protein
MEEPLVHGKMQNDAWLKLVFLVVVLCIAIPALVSYAEGKTSDAAAMLATAAFIAVVFILIVPTGYNIYSRRLQIVFRGPFSFNIPLNTIKKVKVPGAFSFTLNFPSSLSKGHAVEIVRTGGLNVLITPEDRVLFMDKLNDALTKE